MGSEPLHLPDQLDSLPVGWNWCRLDAVCDAIVDCPHSTPILSENGPLVARSQDIRTCVFRVENAARVSEQIYEERISRAEPRYGDLLYSREGTYFGIAAEVPPNTRLCLGQRMVLIRPNTNRMNSRFLKYWLNSPVIASHIYEFRDGTVAERLNLPTIRSLPIAIPPRRQQHSIARILGALDDKIELNRRMNQTLEGLARALFQSWFVDFDPVTAKAAGRKPVGMPAVNARNFPDAFEDSRLGPIPKGWRVAMVPDEIDFLEGPGLRNWQYQDFGMKFLNIRCIGDGDLDIAKANCINLDEFNGRYTHFALNADDIVISTSGTLGRLAIVREDHLPVMLNTSIIRMRSRGPCGFAFIWALLLSDSFQDEMFASATGSVQLNFGPLHLREMKILRPSDKVLVTFESAAQPLLRKVLENRKQAHTLAALRDAFLPRLLSGELRVKDAAKIAETA